MKWFEGDLAASSLLYHFSLLSKHIGTIPKLMLPMMSSKAVPLVPPPCSTSIEI